MRAGLPGSLLSMSPHPPPGTPGAAPRPPAWRAPAVVIGVIAFAAVPAVALSAATRGTGPGAPAGPPRLGASHFIHVGVPQASGAPRAVQARIVSGELDLQAR
jgi:hypothetical protein